MRILIEEYQYDVAKVNDILRGLQYAAEGLRVNSS